MKAAISIPDVDRRKNYFAKACFAVAMATVLHRKPEDFIRRDDDVTALILTRAAITPASAASVGWASIAQGALRSFLVDLGPYSAAGRLIAQAVPAALPPESWKYPVRPAGPTAAPWVQEGGAIPILADGLDVLTLGPSRKLAHIFAWSSSLAKRSDAAAIFEQMLREDIAAGVDAALLSTTADSASAHAGLLYGAPTTTGYGGGDQTAREYDLGYLATTVATGGSGSVTYIMAPERLARLRILAPQLADSMDIAASAAVPADRVIGVDGAALMIAIDPAPDIFMSNEAVLHMSDLPEEIVSGAGAAAAPTRSLWQTDTEAGRVLYDIAFAKRRSTAVAFVDNVTW